MENKKSLYPTTKFWMLLFMFITIALVPGYKYQYAILPLVLLLALFSGVIKQVTLNFLRSTFILCIVIFLMQGIFYPGETILFSVGFIDINQEGIMMSLSLTSKIVAISSLIILFFATTKIKDIVYSLEKMGLSPKATYVILSTLQIIPALSAKSETIMEAQSSRGMETEGNILVRLKTLLPVFTPLVLSSLEATEERVLTLEARAFSSTAKRTHIYTVEKRAIDYILAAVAIIAIILFFVLRGGL